MTKLERYSTIWQNCSENSRLSLRFFVPSYKGHLPFFIWGDALIAFENKQNVELREEHLLKGILYGLYEFDNNPKPWHRAEDRSTLLYLLDVLGNGFKFESPEKMILDVAYDMRQKNGNSASRFVLEVGTKLIPNSSKIKSDLICDLWIISTMIKDREKLLERILSLIKTIDFSQIIPTAKELISYYGLCAIVISKKLNEVEVYLDKYIYPYVSSPDLKAKIRKLLESTKIEVSSGDGSKFL